MARATFRLRASTAEDSFTEPGASRLARRIEAYWRDRGYTVTAWLERKGTPSHPWFAVRSDLVAGVPQGTTPLMLVKRLEAA